MIAFVVPIKPKFNSKDWDKDNQLLNRTLRSICNQTDKRFRVYVVYHDKPQIEFNHPNIKHVFFPYEYLPGDKIADLENYANKWYSSIQYAEYMFDKSKKISYGCKIAKEDGCSYIMAIDSDDLISNKIADYVNSYSTSNCGWVVERGYMYIEGSTLLIKNKCIQGVNGSTHIVRSDLVPTPDFEVNKLFDFNFFESHAYVKTRVLQQHDENLDVLPFYGTIYTINSNNSSDISSLFKFTRLKTLIKILFNGKFLNKEIKNQFMLYKLT